MVDKEKETTYGVELQPNVWRLYQTLRQCVATEGPDIEIFEFKPRSLGKFTIEIKPKFDSKQESGAV